MRGRNHEFGPTRSYDAVALRADPRYGAFRPFMMPQIPGSVMSKPYKLPDPLLEQARALAKAANLSVDSLLESLLNAAEQSRSMADGTNPPTSHAQRSVYQGEIYWLTAKKGSTQGLEAHPYVIIQPDALNFSRLERVTLCALTSNLKRANEPGNILLEPGEGALVRQSVVVVSQIESVSRTLLGERIGALSPERVDQIYRGLSFLARFYRRDR